MLKKNTEVQGQSLTKEQHQKEKTRHKEKQLDKYILFTKQGVSNAHKRTLSASFAEAYPPFVTLGGEEKKKEKYSNALL